MNTDQFFENMILRNKDIGKIYRDAAQNRKYLGITKASAEDKEELKKAILAYVESSIFKITEYASFVNYVTAGILLEEFFAANRAIDSVTSGNRSSNWFDHAIATLGNYMELHWNTVNNHAITDYIHTHSLLSKALSDRNTDLTNNILKCDGVDVCVTDNDGRPMATFFKTTKAIQNLLDKCQTAEKKAEFVNMQDKKNKSVLYYFTYVAPRDYKIISLLIDNGANANIDRNGFITSEKTNDAFIQNLINDGQTDLFKTVAEKPTTKLNIIDKNDGRTLLHTAVVSNAPNIVGIMVTKTPSMINVRDFSDTTPLMYAIKHNVDTEIVNTLLRHNANPNMTDRAGKTPLFFVNDAKAFSYLAANPKTDFAHKDLVDKTFIYYLPDNRSLVQKIGEFLGKNPDTMRRLFACNKYMENPFHWVTSGIACAAFIKILGKNAAPFVQQKNIRGNTPLHWARTAEIAKSLIDAGANVNATNDSNATPLHWAADAEIAKTLVRHRADINATDELNKTPLMYAIEHDNRPVQKYLEQIG